MATRGFEDVTEAAARAMGRRVAHKPPTIPQKARSKYGAVKETVDGITFHSRAEARRYVALKAMERAGQIWDLELQPVFPIIVAGVTVATYRADFRYYQSDGELVVEDVKGMPTPTYRLKKKIVEALYGIQITEVR